MSCSAQGRPSWGTTSTKALCGPFAIFSNTRLQRAANRLAVREGVGSHLRLYSSLSPVVEGVSSSLPVSQTVGLGSVDVDTTEHIIQRLRPGEITRIVSPEELEEVLRARRDAVVILKCKAKHCRPCMAFRRKYVRLAAGFRDVVFLEVFGDDTSQLRKLMMEFNVKATPTFRIYKEGELMTTVVGINEKKVSGALKEAQATPEL